MKWNWNIILAHANNTGVSTSFDLCQLLGLFLLVPFKTSIFKVQNPTEWGPSLVGASASELFLSFWHSSYWLRQVIWHKKYWWHHRALSTRPHSSTSLVTSVKVSWLRPRTPEVSFKYYTWFWLTQLNSTIIGFEPELMNVRYENYN